MARGCALSTVNLSPVAAVIYGMTLSVLAAAALVAGILITMSALASLLRRTVLSRRGR